VGDVNNVAGDVNNIAGDVNNVAGDVNRVTDDVKIEARDVNTAANDGCKKRSSKTTAKQQRQEATLLSVSVIEQDAGKYI
jgi:hypothetical protein